MTDIVIYHNPRCSKSRMTLELIRERGIEPRIVEYLRQPPTADEFDRILSLLDRQPRELMRIKEPEYKEAGLDQEDLSRREQIERMVAFPKVIERPLVLSKRGAAIGRPPEDVLSILD